MADAPLSPIALALGRIPTGLYLVTTRDDDLPLGFVGSFLMQVGFEPPTVCVAIAKGRPHLAAVRASKHFAVSILDADSSGVMNRFFRPPPPGQTPFDGLEVENAPKGCPVIRSSLAWLECRCAGEHATGDHIVVFGEVTSAALLRPGDPSIHLRKNGLGY